MVPFCSKSFQALMGVALRIFSAVSDFWNWRSISRKSRGRSHVVKSLPGCSAVAVRCMKRHRFCWKYCQYQSASSVSMSGTISFGAFAISASRRVIFSSEIGGRALHEAPPVLLEVLPIPIGQQRVHERHHLLRRFRNLRLQTRDLLLRLIALDVAFQRDLLPDGLHGLGVGLVFERALDDGFEVGDGGLGQALLDGLLDLLPLRVARAGDGV